MRFLFYAMSNVLITYICIAFYFLLILSCIIVVVRENRNPIRSLAWIIALVALPIVGLVFYLFFGRSMKGMHMFSRHSKRKLLHDNRSTRVELSELDFSESNCAMVKLASSLCHAPLTLNNNVEIFTDGASKFKRLIEDLSNAKKSIYLQYYIIEDDQLGSKIADILINKAKSGVAVRVIYDNVGSISTGNKFFKKMRENGVDTHPFFKVTFPQLANRVNWRNHRKIVVIDNKIGYIGGMNIADRYLNGPDGGGVWRDTHFRVMGDIVKPLLYSFILDWNFLKKKTEMLYNEVESATTTNNVGMQLVTSGPVETWDNLMLVYLKAISMAKKSIYIQTPYFLPTDSLLHALEAASLAKVDVRIMIPAKCDSKMLQYASFSYVTQCLKAGIKIYLYKPGMLHAKMMIVDDDFVTAGSTNFDFRSFENNFEANLLVYDKSFNQRMREVFFADKRECHKLKLSTWRRRKLSERFMESVVRLVAPIL